MIKCIIFDRDGTLGYLTDNRFPQSFVPFGDIKGVFGEIKKRNILVCIATNQASIARGTGRGYDFEKEFLSYGADHWEICPHCDADACSCRKPKSGMLVRIMEKFSLAPDECFMVGDRLSDVECAKNVGIRPFLIENPCDASEAEKVACLYSDVTVISYFGEILKYID